MFTKDFQIKNNLLENEDKIPSNELIQSYSDFNKPDSEILELANNIFCVLKKKDVVIYGAGTSGKHFYEVLGKHGISISLFVDQNAKNIGEINGVPVYTIEHLKNLEKNTNWIFVVAVNAEQTAIDIIHNLSQFFPDLPIMNGRYLIRVLNFPFCFQQHRAQGIFDILKCMQCGLDVKICNLFTAFLKRESRFDSSAIWGSKKFNWTGVILGQLCTLKCECCCEGIPYIRQGNFSKTEEIISDINKIAESCEYLERLEFIGGEPLLHPGLKRIIEASLSMPKVGYLYIFTNGTVIPDDELCSLFTNPRILLHISNYENEWPENLKNNVSITKEKLAKFGVKYMYVFHSDWLDISKFDDNKLPANELELAFSKCFINFCHRLHDGILYRCPHQYAGVQQNEIQLVEHEFIDVRSLSSDALSDALERFEELKYTDACRHCSMPTGPKQVPAGKQISYLDVDE